MLERLFVYGSLAPGRPNQHVLDRVGGEWEIASVYATLCERGWGTALGFPGVQLDKHGSEIGGYLFSSDNLANHWAELDKFEGEDYERVLTTVKLKDNTTIEAFIYALKAE